MIFPDGDQSIMDVNSQAKEREEASGQWRALVGELAIRKRMVDLVEYLATAQTPMLGFAVDEARRIHDVIKERK